MKKRSWLLACLASCVACSAVGLVACGDSGGDANDENTTWVGPVAILLTPTEIETSVRSSFSLTIRYNWGDFDVVGALNTEGAPQPDFHFSWDCSVAGAIDFRGQEMLDDNSDTVFFETGSYAGDVTLTATSVANPQCYASVNVHIAGEGDEGGGDYAPCPEENLELQLVGDHYVVTGLGSYALGSTDMGTFYGEPNSLIIINQPNGIPITEIAQGAFANNTEITHFESSTVTAIGEGAFENCTALQKIYLQETTGPLTVGDSAFQGCENLEEALLGQMQSVGAYAFADLSKLDYVGGIGLCLRYAPNATVGAHAFENCVALTYLQGGAKDLVVGEYAFAGCSNIFSVYFEAASLGDYALSGCASMSGVDLSLQSVGRYTFAGCDNLARVTFTEHVDTVAANAFENFASLGLVQFNQGVDTISESAFKDCSKLSTIESGGSIDLIGAGAFSGCQKLCEFTVTGGVREVGAEAFKYAGASVDAVQANYGRKYLSYDVSEGTKIFRSEAFENAALQKVNLTKSETIEANVFSYCGGEVENVQLPASYTTVPDSIFKNFTGLKSFIFNEGVTEIGAYAFCNTGWTGTLTIPQSVAKIGDNAFWSTDLTAVKAAEPTVTETEFASFQVGELAFAHCASLEDFDLSAWDTRTTLSKSFGDYAFTECTALKTVYLGNTYSIGYGAFKGVSTLTAFTVTPKLATQTAAMFILNHKTDETLDSAILRDELQSPQAILQWLNSSESDDYKWTSK